MTPQEKAKQLYTAYYLRLNYDYHSAIHTNAKQCALIAVEEILKVTPKKKNWSKETLMQMEANLDDPNDFELPESDEFVFWNQVKTEIEKL